MTTLRAGLRRHPALVACLIVAALALRLLVPAGFMPDWSGGGPTLMLCSGQGPVAMPMHGMAHHAPETPAERPAADQPCAFAGLSLPALAAADPLPLSAALLFAFAAAFPFRHEPPRRPARHLRPPLRGPPAEA